MTNLEGNFSDSYRQASERICLAAREAKWVCDTVLPTDNAHFETHYFRTGSETPKRLLVVTSGLHGVEGFLGSAIQLALINQWQEQLNSLRENAVLLVHALNPFGFERLRRFDENNVDLNRNFLLPGEKYEGANDHYRRLDSFLNPRLWPIREIPFKLKAAWQVARHGLRPLQQAIAEGQYDFPHGLFFGGHEFSKIGDSLEQNLLPRLHSANEILHLDIHSGLGKHGTYQLLLDQEIDHHQQVTMSELFGESIRTAQNKDAYTACGSFNRWIRHHLPQATSLCFEFGTSPPIDVLAALRAENAAYHWGDRQSKVFRNAKEKLREAFCPKSVRWRKMVLQHANKLLSRIFRSWLNES